MIVTDRDDLAERIRLMRSHGMTTLTYDRHKGHAYSYDVVELGFNYRIDEIRSALGLEQLKKLAAARRKIHPGMRLQCIEVLSGFNTGSNATFAALPFMLSNK